MVARLAIGAIAFAVAGQRLELVVVRTFEHQRRRHPRIDPHAVVLAAQDGVPWLAVDEEQRRAQIALRRDTRRTVEARLARDEAAAEGEATHEDGEHHRHRGGGAAEDQPGVVLREIALRHFYVEADRERDGGDEDRINVALGAD